VVLADRRRRWLSNAAGGDEQAFQALLLSRGLSLQDWERSLLDVELRPGAALPRWASLLIEIFDRWTSLGDEALLKGPSWKRDQVLNAFMELGRRSLAEELERHAGLALAVEAREGLMDLLSWRLWQGLGPLLRFEWELHRNHHQAGNGDSLNSYLLRAAGRDAWLERLERHSVAGQLIGTLYGDWHDGMVELLERLATDLPLLAAEFFAGQDPGSLVRLECGAGDPHKGGRSVALLHFEHGLAVAYKPKDLRLAKALGQLTAALERQHPQSAMPTCPALLLRGDYAWEQMVHHQPCTAKEEVLDFYHRLGGWLRLLQLLGGYDFWFDNLIAAAGHPWFIDFETAVHPFQQQPGEQDAIAWLQSLSLDTPANIGILTWLMPVEPGTEPTDLGCTSLPGFHRSPLRPRTGETSFDDHHRLSKDGFLEWGETRYAPYLDGHHQDIASHMDDFQQGYAFMHQCLDSPHGRQLVEDFVAELGGVPLRYILLGTWPCYGFMELVTNPPALASGVHQQIELERLWPFFGQVEPVLLEDAIQDLRRLDIPWYETRADSLSILTAFGNEHPDYFSRSAVDMVRWRLQRLDRQGLERGLALIRSTLSLRTDQPRRVPGRVLASVPNLEKSPDWLDQARKIALEIAPADTFMEHLSGREGIYTEPLNGVSCLMPLGGDLFSGLGGAALLLARLAGHEPGHFLPQQQWQSLVSFLAQTENPHSLPGLLVRDQLCCGAVFGLAGRIYVLACIARELAQPALVLEPIQSLLRQIHAMEEREEWLNSLDYVCGLAGLLCVLGVVHGWFPEWNLAQEAGHWWRVALSQEPSRPLYAPNLRKDRLSRLPGQEAGWWLAAAHWPQLVRELGMPGWVAAPGALSKEAGCGELMVRLMLAKPGLLGKELAAAVRDYLQAEGKEPDSAGGAALLDRLWLALAAQSRDSGFAAQARELGSSLVALRESQGSWFPENWAEDGHRLSAVDGLSSVGLAMLALEESTSQASPPELAPRLIVPVSGRR